MARTHLWPDAKIDVTIHLEPGYDGNIMADAEKLMASSFYIEVEDCTCRVHEFNEVHLAVRCRIPPGHGLTNLIGRLYYKGARLLLRADDGPSLSVLLCPQSVWIETKQEKGFEQRVRVQVGSQRSKICVQLDGVHGAGQHNISGSPCLASSLTRTPIVRDSWTQAERTQGSIEFLQEELANIHL